ncbi:MAG: DNA translocase FtsK [Dysgonamonadaceae bacterium]|jgi:S-DNA-T family DNA segregation ATPase FtsK/SpoIIIE|nr:DNA translocase FtsK [Dysgonamonadaceae bacterium]
MARSKPVAAKKNASNLFSRSKTFIKRNETHYITGLILLIIAVYAILSMISFFFTGAADQSKIEGLSLFHREAVQGIENWTGMRGAILSHILMNEWFGISSFFLLLFLVFLALRLMKAKYFHLLHDFIICAVLTIGLSVALEFFLGNILRETAFLIGGKHGSFLSNWLVTNLGTPGTLLIILLFLVIAMALITPKTIPFLIRLTAKKAKANVSEKPLPVEREYAFPEPVERIEAADEPEETNREMIIDVPVDDDIAEPDEPATETPVAIPLRQPKSGDEDEDDDLIAKLGPYDPTSDLSHYRFPSLDLLEKYETGDTQVNYEEQNENKNRIIKTLEHYNIRIKSIKATVGPTITLYEIVPEDGIRISKIKNLEDDIAMNLSATGIRIIAPMPGKGTIGIEVPNKDAKIVSMYSIIGSRKYRESNCELPIALGKTITNEVFMVDLTKMPHLLVAGATGQGKSVGLNAAITSLLYKKHPAELKLVLVDPKMVEFSIYSSIDKHFLAKLPDAEKPIITDFTKVIYTLNSLTKEMDDRYELLEKAGSRNVKEYNEKFINRRLNPLKGHRFMPYIVVIIDEFGDLIMTAGKEIELPIARIAQKARAVGIHMIIATQRPTTNIITGTIKANFPARIAFRVTSMIDSRTILDGSGANQLIGRGDLLFFQGSDMTRVQCAFVDTPEVDRIAKFIGSQQGYPTAHELPEYTGVEENAEKPGAVNLSNKDPLFEEAARLIVIHQQGSTSLIQRKFNIGYNRAGRLMDQLEAAGIVGPTQGSKPRDVYVPDEYQLEKVLASIP